MTPDLRSLAPTVFFPAVLIGVGQGAIAPVIVLSARELGASVSVASFVVALLGLGQLLGDLPAGVLTARVGARLAMIVAVAVSAVAVVGCVLAPTVETFGLVVVVLGAATSVVIVARHSYLTEVVPYRLRARAMATVGGTQRIGLFAGPFLGAGAMTFWGTDGAYWVYFVSALGAAVLFARLPDAPGMRRTTVSAAEAVPTGMPGMGELLRKHLPLFATLGVGVLLVGAMRVSRQVVIPLWADHIGLEPTTTSLIFGIAGAVDMALFYPAGKAMDRFGRAWVAAPALSVLALAHVLVPLTNSGFALTMAAIVMAAGNGMSSGIMLTLGADVAPKEGRSEFLGAWRLCSDIGSLGGPLLISLVTAAATLGAAIVAMAGLGVASAAALVRWIPRRSMTR